MATGIATHVPRTGRTTLAIRHTSFRTMLAIRHTFL
jgi:hypothetical protein